jgi:Rps23 Pro-64 3,4-dihydroxylase Tpa1-like proline 4-hydroxylase
MSELADYLVDDAIANKVDLYLNGLSATKTYNELLITQSINQHTLKLIPESTFFQHETNNLNDYIIKDYIIRDLFTVLSLLPENQVVLNLSKIENNIDNVVEYLDQDKNFILIHNLLPDKYIKQLKETIANTTEEDIIQFRLHRQKEKFESYSQHIKEDLIEGGMDIFTASDYIPTPENIQLVLNKKIKNLFPGWQEQTLPLLMKHDPQIHFIPNTQKFQDMELHYDIMDNMFALYGIVYYINDDYEGGNLYFPNKNLSIKPKANSLLVFKSGTKDEVHGVELVTKGIRYAIATFV